LTAITSWEMLFHRLAIPEGSAGASVLIVGGTGGVGSMAVRPPTLRCISRGTYGATSRI
jgi:hypothetical protein